MLYLCSLFLIVGINDTVIHHSGDRKETNLLLLQIMPKEYDWLGDSIIIEERWDPHGCHRWWLRKCGQFLARAPQPPSPVSCISNHVDSHNGLISVQKFQYFPVKKRITNEVIFLENAYGITCCFDPNFF